MFIFSDRIVLITGASRGIGRAAAVKFAAAGAAGVVINYQRDGEAAAAVAEAVERAGSQPLIVRADISRADETATLVEAALQRFGRLDVMVANAGIWPPQERAITDLDEDQWERTMRINVDGIYHVSRAVARIFVAQRRGNIVTVSSTAGQRGEAGHADYAASKGAVISFTKSLAAELGRFNVRVNCVAPGWVDTDMAAPALQDDPSLLRKIEETMPLGRLATAEDIAGPILFLASDLARHITGEILNVNGGSVLCG